MKKFASRILILSLIFASAILGLYACGDPYKDMKMEVSSPEITYNNALGRNEFVLSSSSTIITIEAKISGGDSSVDKRVNISLEQPTEVLEPYGEVEDSAAQSSGVTSAKFMVKNGGYATIKCVSREGGLIQTYKVYVAIPIENVTFSNDIVPIVKGQTTDIANSLANENTLFDYINFTPSNTNQKDTLEFVFEDEAPQGVSIQGTKISVASNCQTSSFNLKAKYIDVNGEEKETETITFKVLTPFDVNKVKAFNQNSSKETEAKRDEQNNYLYHLKLSTNLKQEYESSYQALLAFKYEEIFGSGEYNRNVLNPLDYSSSNPFSYGTEYSITCESELKSNTIASYSQVLEIKRTNSYNFNIVHKNYAITTDIKFYVNYKGYEEFFPDTVITVRVEILAFPESISVANSEEDALRGEEISNVSVYTEYSSDLKGTPLFVSVLGPDNQELNMEKFTARILDDDDKLELLVKRGASYIAIDDNTELTSGTELFLRIKQNAGEITTTQARVVFSAVLNKEFSDGEVEKEIIVNIITEAVKWDSLDGNGTAEIYMNYTKSNTYNFVFTEFVSPTWLDNEGNKKQVYSALKASDFKVEGANSEIVFVGSINSNINSIEITNARNKLGTTNITITTPNGFILTIKVSVVINLTEESLVLSFTDYNGNIEIRPTDENNQSFTALVGDRQTFDLYYVSSETGFRYKLGYNNGYNSIMNRSTNPRSVRVENGNEIVALNTSSVENQPLITISIDGYSWDSDEAVSTVAPEVKTFEFKFNILVLNPVSSLNLDKTSTAIFTKETLNNYRDESIPDSLSEFETKGKTTITLSVNPSNVTTNKNIYWKLYRDLDGGLIADNVDILIGSNNRSGSINYTIAGVRIFYEVSEDLTSLTLYAELDQDADKTKTLSINIYAYAYIEEQYVDFYGESYVKTFSRHARVSISNAVLVNQIIPEVAFNTISFDKREMVVDEDKTTEERTYFDQTDENSYIEFSYKLNPVNPENKKIVAGVSDSSIRAEVDYEAQKVRVYVVSINNNETPVFTLYLSSADSQSITDKVNFSCTELIIVKVQDGLNVPFEISSEEDLTFLANHPEAYDYNYVLTDNIILTDAWTPIGSLENPFTGSFNGANTLEDGTVIKYTISGLKLDLTIDSDNRYLGMFGVTKDAELLNIRLNNVSLALKASGDFTEDIGIGSLVGLAINTKITEAYIDDGNLLSDLNGSKLATINNSSFGISFSTNIQNGSMVSIGGMVGTMLGGIVENSSVLTKITYNPATNTSLITYLGGMVGYLSSSDNGYKDSEGNSAIDIGMPNIIFSENHSQIYNVVSYIKVSDVEYVSSEQTSAFGGVVGLNNGYIQGGKFRTIIEAKDNLGGIAGINLNKIEKATVSPNLIGNKNLGGAVGTNSSSLLNYTNGLITYGIPRIGSFIFDLEFSEYKFSLETSKVGLGLITETKIQFLDYGDMFSYLNTAIAGVDALGGLIGLNIQNCSGYSFNTALSYNSVYTYVSSEMKISGNYNTSNKESLYYGDIVLLKYSPNQAVGGLVGTANNIALINAYAFVNINQNNVTSSNDYSAIVGGALGNILPGTETGHILLSDLNIKGYVSYFDQDGQFIDSSSEYPVGGFIGDAQNIDERLFFKSDSGATVFEYSKLAGFNVDGKAYPFYNIQSSYTLLRFYNSDGLNTPYVENFAGRNEKSNAIGLSYTDKYTLQLYYDNVNYDNSNKGLAEKVNNFISEVKVDVSNFLTNAIYNLLDNVIYVNMGTTTFSEIEEVLALKYRVTITSFNGITGEKTISHFYYTDWNNIPSVLTDGYTEASATGYAPKEIVIASAATYQKPIVLTSNSYYIGFNAYLRNDEGFISENKIEISESLAKGGTTSFDYYNKDANGDYVLYISNNGNPSFAEISSCTECNAFGLGGTGFFKLPNNMILSLEDFNARRYSKSVTASNVSIYENWFFDNINNSPVIAGLYASENAWELLKVEDINNFTGWDENNGKPENLEDYNEYLNNGVNDGYPILLSKDKEKNGNVDFVVDLPPKSINVEYNYDHENAYQGESEVVDSTTKDEDFGIVSQDITVSKVTDYVTLTYYKVDSSLLPELFGYYDFNGDGSMEATQNEKIYTSHVKAIVREKNKYLLNEIINIQAEPAFLNISDLTVLSSSSLIEIEYSQEGINVILLGSGKAEIEIYSNLNREIYKKVSLNIINKVSGVELFSDSTLENKVTSDSVFRIVKGYDKKLYIKTEEYLDGINQGLINLYGNVVLAKNSVFNIGVRYYLVAEDLEKELTIYHADKDIPAGFTINGLPFKALSTENGYLIYVDVDSITNVSFYGIEKSAYKLMAVPYMYEKVDGDKTLLNKGALSISSGELFGIEIIDGTFGITSSIDSNTDPFKPINFEATIVTDNFDAKSYLSVEKIAGQTKSYMEIKELEKVSEVEGVEKIATFKDSNGNNITIENVKIYELPTNPLTFTFDKFQVKITGINYYNESNQKIDIESDANSLKYIKYSFQVSVLEEYLYHIGEIENFVFKFYTVKTAEISNEEVIETSFTYNITPQEVENVELYHYADIQLQTIDVSTGQQTVITEVNQDFISNTLVCGEPGLLHINVHPGYSDVEYVEITSSSTGGFKVDLEQMYANYIENTNEELADKYIFNGTYTALPDLDNISINNGLGIKLLPNSFGYLQNGETLFDYNGNFYVKTSIPTLYDATIVFTLTIKGFANGKEVFSEELKLTPQLKPEIEFHSHGKTEIPIAIGTEIEITLKSDGIIDESSKFTIISDSEDYINASQETLKNRYIFSLSPKAGTTDKYILTVPFNEEIIGEVFYLQVMAYKDVNNNRYETIKRIAIKPSLYVVDKIFVDNVEYIEENFGYLKGNYNQDYALKVLVDANYCVDTDMINKALNAGADDDFATPKIEEILREIEKLQATLSSYGLYGEYKCLDEEDANAESGYKYGNEDVMEWQAEANKFGETERLLEDMKNLKVWEEEITTADGEYISANPYGYIGYSSKSWYVVEGNIESTVSVNDSYKGIAIDNGRAEYLLTDRFIGEDGYGYNLREPYATLNVRVTDINTDTILKFQAEIDYGSDYGSTGVGIKLDGINSNFASHFETKFGFDVLQLANEENPEPIYTTEEFKNMSSGGHYILMEDIELDMWTPLNTEIASFDGNGYVIRLNSFNEFGDNSDKNIGVFGTVGENTILKNLIVEIPPSNRIFDETGELSSSTEGDLVVRVSNLANVKFGVIAGQNAGTITNAIVINNADSYREERDMLLFNNGSNGKITQTELEERRRKYYSAYINENTLALDSNRTSTIISVIQTGSTENMENTDSADIRIGGFVGLNSGFITNSAVENISLISSYYVAGFVCENENNAKISSSYFKGGNVVNVNIGSSANYSNNGTAGFAVINRGEINYSYVYGREIGAETNISGVNENSIDKSANNTDTKGDLYVDRYVGLRYTYSGLTSGRDNDLNNYLDKNKTNLDTIFNMRALGTIIKSVGTATGFVYNNSGTITNSYSNIFVMADSSSGFVYINDSEATIQNSFTLSSVQNMDTDHTAFSGVTYESGTFVDLGKGNIENCYYLKVNEEDYQELYELYNSLDISIQEQKALKEKLESYGPFLGNITTIEGLTSVVNSEEKWVDKFSEYSTEQALPLSAIEFASYTSFVSFSFNSDYSLNGKFDPDVEGSGEENLARAVWFIPEGDDNDALENKAISNYFKHQSYTSRIPQLVSANLKTMSLRYANFIKQLPADSSMKTVLETLQEKMGYARIGTVLKGMTPDKDDKVALNSNLEIFEAILRTDSEDPYAVGYAKELGEAIINAYLEVKYVPQDEWPRISGTNTIENQINTYFKDGTFTTKISEKDILDILIVAVNSLNAVTENSDASYSYSYVQSNMKGIDINYGESVLNPYLVSSAEKFNIYTLQINTLGEITETEQGASLRLIKDIAFDNVIQTAKTYKATFFGDFEGNGLTINDLKIVAEDDEEVKQEISKGIQNLGLFGVVTNNKETGEKANIRNLNIDVDAISATAVRYVGGLAGQINGGEVHNIRIIGDEDSSIQGFNATGGLAGRISGENTLVSNIYNSVSIKSNYYSTPYNVYSATFEDDEHRFNLYLESQPEIRDEEGQIIQEEISSNINKVSYAGGIAGILEAKEIFAIGSEDAKINANIRSNTVTGDIEIRGEVVGGLFGYVGNYSKISNSTVKATSNLRINASAVGGGLVGDLRGEITTSNVVNTNQDIIDQIIYDTVYNVNNSMKSTIGLDILFENEATSMFSGNAHYIGGIAGLSYRGSITYSFNRVDVANINSKYAGGVVGLSIGLTLSNVYTTASVNSFIAYGGLIGIQTIDNIEKNLFGDSALNDFHIANWEEISVAPDTTPISLNAVVGANLWKEEHKNTNRKTYRIDAVRAQIGSFIGRAVSYNEKSPYYSNNNYVWYSDDTNPLAKRVKNESVFFMMDYSANGTSLIYEIGNATSIKVNFSEDELKYVENTSDESLPHIVRNSTAYVAFEEGPTYATAYAYSGDFSSKMKVSEEDGDENYKYYRFSRLQNYGSLRTIKEIIQGVYLQSETAISGLTARIYDSNFTRYDENGSFILDALDNKEHYIETNVVTTGRTGELSLEELLVSKDNSTSKFATNEENPVNSQPQTIYNNWASDAWLGVEMDVNNSGFGGRQNIVNYVFPKNRTKVFEDVIYVITPWDLINNTENHPDATYIILNDINLDEINDGWQPLNSKANPFTGTLKSYGGYTLRGFSANDSAIGEDYGLFGLFAYAEDAEFSNFSIDVQNLEISGTDSFGILVGTAKDSNFERISIIADNNSTISTNAQYVGGIVGKVITEKITLTKFINCSVTLDTAEGFKLTNQNVKAGLFVGSGNNLQIANTFAYGLFVGGAFKDASVGGIVGEAKGEVQLYYAYSTGYIEYSTATNSNIGGLIGKAELTEIVSSASNISIFQLEEGISNSNIGGLVGLIDCKVRISQDLETKAPQTLIKLSVSNVDMFGIYGSNNNIGGIVGKIDTNIKDVIENVYSTGNIDINNKSNNVGGIVGAIEKTSGTDISIISSYSMSKISKNVAGGGSIGGVVGSYKANDIEATDKDFESALYVYDFMPESNSYGTPKTSYQFRTLTIEELGLSTANLVESGAIPKPETEEPSVIDDDPDKEEVALLWNPGGIDETNKTLSYPTMNIPFFENLPIQKVGSNQVSPIISHEADIQLGMSSVYYKGQNLDALVMMLDLTDVTVYLDENLEHKGTNTLEIGPLSAVFGLNTGSLIKNSGTISESKLSNLESSNGYLIQSYVYSESSYNQNLQNDDKWFNSYVLYVGADGTERNAVYYNTNAESMNATEKNEIKDFIEAGFDFENIWTVYHIKDNEENVLLGFTPVLKWEISEDDYHGGDQTKGIEKITSSTYEVKTIDDYVKIVKAYNASNNEVSFVNKNVIISIVADLDFSGKILTPIGTKDNPFCGTIQGNGHYLSGILMIGNGSLGLVGYAGNGATIQNLHIRDNDKAGAIFGTNGSVVGALVGTNVENSTITIKNCRLESANIDGSNRLEIIGDIAGGIVGLDKGKVQIENLAFEGYVYGNSVAGGFVGKHENYNSALSIKKAYISNGEMTNANEQNIFGKGIKGLLVGQIIGREDTGNRYFFHEIYVSTRFESRIKYLGECVYKIAASFNGLVSFVEITGMGNVSYDDTKNYYTLTDADLLKTEYFEGFSWGAVWTRQSGINNGYPIFFDFWSEGAKIPNVPNLTGSGQIVSGDITDLERSFISEFNNLIDKTIEIDEAAELAWIARAVNLGLTSFEGCTIRLTNNIYLENKGWNAIGTEENPFKGTFDGGYGESGKYDISSLDGIGFVEGYSGLFGYIEGATIKNINLASGKVEGKEYVGSVVGYAKNSHLSNISSSVKVNVLASETEKQTLYIGGVVGYSENTILIDLQYTYVSTSTYINANNFKGLQTIYIGGIVGYANGGNILTNLTSTINLNVQANAIQSFAGGIAGYVYNIASIYALESKGSVNVSAQTGYVGGTIGNYIVNATQDVVIYDITNNAKVTSGVQAGGIFGNIEITNESLTYNVAITALTNQADVSAAEADYVGGIIGSLYVKANSLTLSEFSNSGAITGNTNVGGAIGYMNYVCNSALTISNMTNSNKVNAKGNVGGVIGTIISSEANENTISIEEISNIGEVNANGGSYSGGIFGSATLNGVKSLKIGETLGISNSANVVIGGDYSGGIFGNLLVTCIEDGEVIIKNLTNNGSILYKADSSWIGGIFGNIEINSGAINVVSISMEELSNYGDISANGGENVQSPSHFGGIAGNMDFHITAQSGSINLTKLNNSGIVGGAGADYVAGIVGSLTSSLEVSAKDLINSGAITGKDYVAGLIGSADNKKLNISSNFDVDILEEKYETIYSSEVDEFTEIRKELYQLTYQNKVLNSGLVSGDQYVGGFVGFGSNVSIQGSQEDNTIKMLVNTGNVTAQGSDDSYVGGIIGSSNSSEYASQVESALETSKLSYLENSGKITGNNLVGGIAGYAISDTKVLSNAGDVSGSMLVGGIVGDMIGKMDIVKNAGNITASSTAGGVVGRFGLDYIDKGDGNFELTGLSILKNFQSLNNGLEPSLARTIGSLVGSIVYKKSGTLYQNSFSEDIVWLGLDGSYSERDEDENEIGFVGDPLVVGNFIGNTYISNKKVPITNYGTVNDGTNTLTHYYSESSQWTIYSEGIAGRISVILADVSQVTI